MSAPDKDDDGLAFLVTPIQLAALLQHASLAKGPSLANRFWGGLGIIGGAVDLVASTPLWLAPEPTMATKVAAGALDYVGTDTMWTGMRQVWTGRTVKTLTAQVVQRSLRSLGVDGDLAERLGSSTEFSMNLAAAVAAPLTLARAARATRVVAVERGLISLEEEETWPGAHTLKEHVDRRTIQQLQMRFVEKPWLRNASVFDSRLAAERAISGAIAANADDIRAWASLAQADEQFGWPAYECGEVIGQVLVKKTGQLVDATKVIIVLKKTTNMNKVWYLFTAYPVLR